jgi:hypothetical protein
VPASVPIFTSSTRTAVHRFSPAVQLSTTVIGLFLAQRHAEDELSAVPGRAFMLALQTIGITRTEYPREPFSHRTRGLSSTAK